MSDGWSVWLALYDAIDAGASAPLYVTVPEGAAYPYITLASDLATGEDWLTLDRQDRNIVLAVWSSQAGNKQVHDIMTEIRTAVHRKRLTLASGHAYHTAVIRERAVIDSDGKTYTGQVTIRVKTHS